MKWWGLNRQAIYVEKLKEKIDAQIVFIDIIDSFVKNQKKINIQIRV